jgi:Plant transposon protein
LIHCDYLGLNQLLGAEFQLMFSLLQGWLQIHWKMLCPLYINNSNQNHQPSAIFEAKLLMPLKCWCTAYLLIVLWIISLAGTMCLEVGGQFDAVVADLYKEEYLCIPDGNNLKSICQLHKGAHGVDGMVGSLDCLDTYWKTCPKAWQGSFQGKERKPTVVLEALCNQHMFFWHVSYGYAGCLNDINILNLSPFLE